MTARPKYPTTVALSLMMALTGCISPPVGPVEAAPESASAELTLEPPARGVHVRSPLLWVDPGEDLRLCEIVALPGGQQDVYFIDRIESELADGARDLIVHALDLGSETEAIADIGSRVACTRAGEAFGEDLEDVTSVRVGYRDQQFPDGVGKILYGGQKLALEYHVVNTGDAPASVGLALSFHTVEEKTIRRVAHTAGFHNLTIYTPPLGQSSHLAECLVKQEVLVSELARRTGRWGTGFAVWQVGGDRDGELLWHSAGPHNAALSLEEPLRFQAGEGFRFQCDYNNTTDLELRFGIGDHDESCTLEATYWVEGQGVGPAQDGSSPEGCLVLDVDPDGVARD
ncbi:MAG: hypothetical protein OEZ06_26380 [Myxococcales bacterium]|nr:hypothetical protein [Myxococcales bacterium]